MNQKSEFVIIQPNISLLFTINSNDKHYNYSFLKNSMSNQNFRPVNLTPPSQMRPPTMMRQQFVVQTYTPTDPHRLHFGHVNHTFNGQQQQQPVPQYRNYEPISQSTILPNRNSPQQFSRPINRLEFMARKVQANDQVSHRPGSTIDGIRQSHEIISMERQNKFKQGEQYSQGLYSSQIMPAFLNEPIQNSNRLVESGELKNRPQQDNKIANQQFQSNIKLQLNQNRNFDIYRQNKTDRDMIKNTVSGNNPQKISDLNLLQVPTYENKNRMKNNFQSFESTHSSSGNSNNPSQIKQIRIGNQPDFLANVKKMPSPQSYWPLAVSPSEEKMQSFNSKQKFDFGENPKQKQQLQSQFKKKKPTDYLLKKQPQRKIEQKQRSFSLENFQLLEKIGKGAFGDVFVAREQTIGFMCVLKKILKKKIKQLHLEEHLLREIKIQSYLSHKHLTSLYCFFADEQYIYLVLELMPDGSFSQTYKKKRFNESQCSGFLRQICQGLNYMHTEEIIHRDLKPQNIFVHNGYLKIGDFGCSIFSQSLRRTIVGSLAYISPEQLKQDYYDDKIDVWSIGIWAYEILVGRSPFQDDMLKIARQEIEPKLSELRFPLEPELSSQAKDFISRLLNQNPSQRMDIATALKHNFIRKYQQRGTEDGRV